MTGLYSEKDKIRFGVSNVNATTLEVINSDDDDKKKKRAICRERKEQEKRVTIGKSSENRYHNT
jgi:hypothetical protein